MKRYRLSIALAAITAAFVLVAADYADARAGRGFSGGSRGNRTFMAPPATKTAPTPAQPIQRSTTQPAAPVAGAPAGAAAGAAAAAPRAGMFGGGLMGGLAAGFIGAGLFGLLFGSGLFGGMAGFASIIGLLLQVLLIVIVARLAYSWWQRRNAPAAAAAYAGGPAAAGPAPAPSPAASTAQFTGLGTLFGGNKPSGAPLAVVEADYDAFEKLLDEVQTAYSDEDEASLRAYVTPEMVTYFSEELSANAERGVVNKITDVKLLQGDLAEAWREDDAEYATVAMRFALTDRMVDRDTGAHRRRRRAGRGHRAVDVQAGARPRLEAVGDPAGVTPRRPNGRSCQTDLTAAPSGAAVSLRAVALGMVTAFLPPACGRNRTPIWKRSRQTTSQMRRAEPLPASSRTKLSGTLSPSSMAMRAPVSDTSDRTQPCGPFSSAIHAV